MKKLPVVLLALCYSLAGLAQHFTKETEPLKIEKNGFYNILITPSISGFLKDDFSDIRIYDQKNTETPYLLRTEEALISGKLFKEYKIVEDSVIKKCCTKLVLQNSAKSKINNISLIIKNSDVRRKATLSGSNDKTSWYTIKEDYEFEAVYNSNETSEIKLVNFPLLDYEYYKLDIADSNHAPLNILKAGYYDYYSEEGKYTQLPSPILTQRDSTEEKKTYARITFAEPQFIDKLSFKIKGPAYYKRSVTIFKTVTRNKKQATEILSQTEFRSNSENVVELANEKVKDLYLLIDNMDNPPLELQAVTASQLNRYLTAFLTTDNSYTIRFEDKNCFSPNYDLSYFKDSIPKVIPLLTPGKITTIGQEATVQESFFKSVAWIWIAIAAVIIILGYMTMKMVKEMNAKK